MGMGTESRVRNGDHYLVPEHAALPALKPSTGERNEVNKDGGA